jgi:hypothetical protein
VSHRTPGCRVGSHEARGIVAIQYLACLLVHRILPGRAAVTGRGVVEVESSELSELDRVPASSVINF